MRFIVLLICSILFMGAASCTTSPVNPTVRPIDANKYELPFVFTCNGVDTFTVGTGHCQYKVGDVMHIKIKTPQDRGEIQVRSCRHSRSVDVDTNQVWQEFDWVQYTREDSCPIAMSVVTQNGGTQIGKIYPYVSDDKYPPLNGHGNLYCYQTEKVEQFTGQMSCQFPVGIRVTGFYTPDPAKSGQFIIVMSTCGSQIGPRAFQKNSPPIQWSLTSPTTQFCPVSVATKYDDGTIDEQEVYLDFFNNGYNPLPNPILVQRGNNSYACAPQDYHFFDLNDHTKESGLLSGKCIKDGWDANGYARAVAWDTAGRVSFSVIQKQGAKASSSFIFQKVK